MLRKPHISLFVPAAAVFAIFAFTALVTPPAAAEQACNQQCVTDLVRAGTILPLEEIIERSGITRQGEIIGTRLLCVDDRWFYNFRILDAAGNNVVSQYTDASSGRIVSSPEDQ
jgi:uncharacterized membrane protein YkoI